ncbi:uncharacterized protein NEMAJ01_0117 [Nematocida major]|uniref:uncharacterized protein n=1 Tax=Nematocida major TaxID=1912982 RepID=UPI002008AF83|nr:uncharacterized protein NEMAJ01_0117 [Nematocida major]KAH9385221.1 hypothetical protein NEMAJ01_0117 [Nematocida major]
MKMCSSIKAHLRVMCAVFFVRAILSGRSIASRAIFVTKHKYTTIYEDVEMDFDNDLSFETGACREETAIASTALPPAEKQEYACALNGTKKKFAKYSSAAIQNQRAWNNKNLSPSPSETSCSDTESVQMECMESEQGFMPSPRFKRRNRKAISAINAELDISPNRRTEGRIKKNTLWSLLRGAVDFENSAFKTFSISNFCRICIEKSDGSSFCGISLKTIEMLNAFVMENMESQASGVCEYNWESFIEKENEEEDIYVESMPYNLAEDFLLKNNADLPCQDECLENMLVSIKMLISTPKVLTLLVRLVQLNASLASIYRCTTDECRYVFSKIMKKHIGKAISDDSFINMISWLSLLASFQATIKDSNNSKYVGLLYETEVEIYRMLNMHWGTEMAGLDASDTTLFMYKKLYGFIMALYELTEMCIGFWDSNLSILESAMLAPEEYRINRIKMDMGRTRIMGTLTKSRETTNNAPHVTILDVDMAFEHVCYVDSHEQTRKIVILPKSSVSIPCKHIVNHIYALYKVPHNNIHLFGVNTETRRWSIKDISSTEYLNSRDPKTNEVLAFYYIPEVLLHDSDASLLFVEFEGPAEHRTAGTIRLPLFFNKLMASALDLTAYKFEPRGDVATPEPIMSLREISSTLPCTYVPGESSGVNYYAGLTFSPETTDIDLEIANSSMKVSNLKICKGEPKLEITYYTRLIRPNQHYNIFFEKRCAFKNLSAGKPIGDEVHGLGRAGASFQTLEPSRKGVACSSAFPGSFTFMSLEKLNHEECKSESGGNGKKAQPTQNLTRKPQKLEYAVVFPLQHEIINAAGVKHALLTHLRQYQ